MRAKRIVALTLLLTLLTMVGCGKANKEICYPEQDVLWSATDRVPNENGQIGNGGGDTGMVYDESVPAADGAYEVIKRTTVAATAAVPDGGYYKEPSASPGDGMWGTIEYPPYVTPEQIHAGMLTASEWRDNENFTAWVEKLTDNNWYKTASDWSVLSKNRVKVTVKNEDAAVENVAVRLLDANGTVLWRGVTDNRGVAYLFYGLDGSVAEPTAVEIGETRVTLDGAQEVLVQVDVAHRATGLDLMFMVDTTGSMGDELEFLKEELADVVSRIGEKSSLPVRTSVNFYRDEGDEYVVRYFRFEENVADSVEHIRAQVAHGGGDNPEAVHTALDNAVTGHAWNKDSARVLVLVLDAPPHDESTVRESLAKTIAQAAEMGIRIIPVVSSGSDTLTEILCRSFAVMTGGSYVYLTDDSGYGAPHTEQHIDETPEVEPLNDLLVRIISSYCE